MSSLDSTHVGGQNCLTGNFVEYTGFCSARLSLRGMAFFADAVYLPFCFKWSRPYGLLLQPSSEQNGDPVQSRWRELLIIWCRNALARRAIACEAAHRGVPVSPCRICGGLNHTDCCRYTDIPILLPSLAPPTAPAGAIRMQCWADLEQRV
jgi:hypothetical protein